MKIRTGIILLAFSAALLAQTAVLARPAVAQTYGESVYGGGVYEDPRTTPEADQSSTSTGQSVPVPSSNTTNPSVERDADEEQESSGDEQIDSDFDDSRDNGDATAEPDNKESIESEPNSRPYLVWLSLVSLTAALLLILFAVWRRRRKQD